MSQKARVAHSKNVSSRRLLIESEENCDNTLEDPLVQKSQKLNGNVDNDETIMVNLCLLQRLGKLIAKDYVMQKLLFPAPEDFVFSSKSNSFLLLMRAHGTFERFDKPQYGGSHEYRTVEITAQNNLAESIR